MTPAEKQKRYAYAKARRQRLNEEMRRAGIIGQPRMKMTAEEKKAKRKAYSKAYRAKIQAEARAYREMQAGGAALKRGRRKA